MSIAQNSIIKVAIFFTTIALIFALGFLFLNAKVGAAAEEAGTVDAQATDLAAQDQNITHEDLGVGDPNILPGNPLYAFKNVRRGFQSFFTFDPAAKVELKLKFANEKIIEAKKLAEGGADDERVTAAIKNYEKETERVKVRIENLKDSGKTKEEIELIVKHTADSQIKHHKALGKMMKEHDNIAPEIEAGKATAMKSFSESMATVVGPEVLAQKFEEVIKEQKGSAFRHFKHIEVLEEVKDFVPAQAKDAIQNAIVQSSKLFEEEFKNAEVDQRTVFNKYMERIGGNEVRHLEAFDAINSFADIGKEMGAEMERAREKTRTRVEERMKGIKDETRKKVFVAHLEDAKMEDLRIVKELENNLDPATITTILDIKHNMEQKMREKFEGAQSSGDLNSFFKEIEGAPDVKMMEVMKEMEQIIPPDKKAFFEEMKKKAVTEMQKGLEEARRFGRLEAELQQVAGFDPEHMAVLDTFQGEFGPQFDFFQDIQREQATRMQERFQNFNEFAAERPADATFFEGAEAFRLRIQQDPTAQANIQQFAPQISQDFQKFDVDRAQRSFEGKDVTKKIEDAQIAIQQLASALENASSDTPGIEAAQSLLANARKHLENAQGTQAAGEQGGAFGQAISAFHNATNGVRKLEKTGFEEQRHKYFEKRDEFREQFKGVPAAERPTFEAGVPVKPPSFQDFKFERFRGAPSAELGAPAEEGLICAQVITPARHAGSGACRTFPNACLPPGWVADSACEAKGEIHKVLPRFEIPEAEKQNFIDLEKRHLEEFKKREGEIRVTPTKEEQERLEERRRTEPKAFPGPLRERTETLQKEETKPIFDDFQFRQVLPKLQPGPAPVPLAPAPTLQQPAPTIAPVTEQHKIIEPTPTHTITPIAPISPIAPAPSPTTSPAPSTFVAPSSGTPTSAPTSGSAPSSGGGFSH